MDRFVVGTGRCGSTLLSRMLAEHDDVLSIFEFFNGLDMQRCFAPTLTGPELAALISAEQPFVTAVLRRGYPVAEVTYPFDAPNACYRRDQGLPWILVSMLPALIDAPDAPDAPDQLYERTLAWVEAQPERPAADQYRALFGWLGEQIGKPIWIERSGSSINYTGALAGHFAGARFVHLHREGPEVALSMREHHAYRLAIAFGYDLPLEDGRRPSELGALDINAEPSATDPVSLILGSRPDPVAFGRYWQDQLQRGLEAMESLPSTSVLHVRFEDLIANPSNVLATIAEFFELESGPWLQRAAALVSTAPPRRLPQLPAEEAAALTETCRPATERLATLTA